MKEANRDSSQSLAKDLATLGSFLIFGGASGLLFAALVTRTDLQQFFYSKGDKFPIPRYSYWFTFSLLQLAALGGAFLDCISRRWLRSTLKRRDIAAALTIGLATPALRLLTPLMNSNMGPDWDFLVAPVVFMLLLSSALCMFSGNLKLFPLAVIWNLVFTIAGFVFLYASVRLIYGSSEWYEFIQWPILESMVGLSFGSWLIWRQRVRVYAASEQVLAADSVSRRTCKVAWDNR
jgi:hypothetical protein